MIFVFSLLQCDITHISSMQVKLWTHTMEHVVSRGLSNTLCTVRSSYSTLNRAATCDTPFSSGIASTTADISVNIARLVAGSDNKNPFFAA